MLKLLGLIDASVDLREVSASVFSEGVAGYYDPRTKRMRTVRGAATGTKVLAEMVLAHELTHALEDQRYGLGLEDQGGSDDAALARLALVEGSASDLMYAYARRHFTAEETLGGVLGSAFAPTGSLPAFLQAQLVFPYTGGAEFVGALRERAGGRWTLVDLAERSRPPASTEQVMHPEKWVRVEPPVRVRVRAGEALGDGWERAAGGVLGEFQTRELLADAGGGGSSTAAAGWGGDRYELWRRGAGESRRDAALIVRWRWDTPADAREFEAKLRQWVRGRARGHGAGRRDLRDRRGPRGRRGPGWRRDAGDGAVRAAGAAARGRSLSAGERQRRLGGEAGRPAGRGFPRSGAQREIDCAETVGLAGVSAQSIRRRRGLRGTPHAPAPPASPPRAVDVRHAPRPRLKSSSDAADPEDMRSFLRRLAKPSCSSCRGRSSAYAVACAGCGVDMGPKRAIRRDSALVWLLGGAIVGCLTMLALAPTPG